MYNRSNILNESKVKSIRSELKHLGLLSIDVAEKSEVESKIGDIDDMLRQFSEKYNLHGY